MRRSKSWCVPSRGARRRHRCDCGFPWQPVRAPPRCVHRPRQLRPAHRCGAPVSHPRHRLAPDVRARDSDCPRAVRGEIRVSRSATGHPRPTPPQLRIRGRSARPVCSARLQRPSPTARLARCVAGDRRHDSDPDSDPGPDPDSGPDSGSGGARRAAVRCRGDGGRRLPRARDGSNRGGHRDDHCLSTSAAS